MLQPAAHALNRFTLKTKFTVIGIAITLVVAIPLLHLTGKQTSAIAMAGEELDGLQVLRPLREVLQQVVNLRAAQLGNDTDAVKKTQQTFDPLLKSLDQAVKDYDNKAVNEQWAVLKPQLPALKLAQPSSSEGGNAYRAALSKLTHLISLTADTSGLTLDPELDSYFLTNNSAVLLPRLVQNIVELSSPGSGQVAQADDGNAFGDAMPDGVVMDPPPVETPEPAATTPAPTVEASAATASSASAAIAVPAVEEPAAVAPITAGAALLYQALSRLEDGHAVLVSNLDKITLQSPQLKEGQQQARREYTLTFNEYLEDARELLEKPDRSIRDSELNIHEKLFNLYDVNLKQLQERVEERHSELRSSLVWEWLIVGALGVLLYLLFRTIQRGLLGSLQRMADGLKRIADGDMQTTIHINSQDELQTMASAINAMVSELRELLSVAQESSHTLYAELENLNLSSRQMQSSTVEQTGAATHMANSIGELSFSINQIASQAQHGSEASSRTSAISEESSTVIQRMAEEMSTISESVRTTATAIESLGDHSDKISSVVQVIKEVAGQTNLLALNAAIEAARAGEQGRGFAVVADEVRKLAERTTRSTQEIAEIIESIQAATMNAILSMGSVVSRVNEGVELANNAGSAITQIRTQGEQTQTMVNDISNTLQEHASTGQKLTDAVQKIAALSVTTSEIAQNAAQTTGNMHALASRLQETIGRFRI